MLTTSVQHPRPDSGWVLALGTLVLAAAAARLVLLGRAAALGSSSRRGVNVVWDVMAFWPRAVHPFVPPPYSQSVVPRLAERIAHHRLMGRSVVLCGHSQGSLISFATLVRGVGPEGVGLVTLGSQLQVLFTRAFPAAVNLPAIEDLMGALGGRWRNLYRGTDPLAGPVLSWRHDADPPTSIEGGPGGPFDPGATAYGADWCLLDPPVPDPALQERPLLPLRRHSDFWADPSWPRAVTVVAPAGGPVGTPDGPLRPSRVGGESDGPEEHGQVERAHTPPTGRSDIGIRAGEP